MSAQHTPGPWLSKATAGNHDFAIYPEATGRDVALVRDFHEANACLIAAAPELLETGMDDFLADEIRACLIGDTLAVFNEWHAKHRSALSKAEGRDV